MIGVLVETAGANAAWLGWWRDSLVACALLIVMVLVLRRPVARRFGPRMAYALWTIPALRLMLPALPALPWAPVAAGDGAAGFAQVLPVSGAAIPPYAATLSGPLTVADAPLATPAATMLLPEWLLPALFIIWFAGAALMLSHGWAAHCRYRRTLLTDAQLLRVEGRVAILTSPAAAGPVALGLRRPVIVLPADHDVRYSAAEQQLVLAHERAHHRHGDLWANAAALVVLAAQWWNPFAWTAWRAFRFDQEAACDARVLARRDGGEGGAPERTATYAAALLKTAAGPHFALAAPMRSTAPHNDHLKERLTMLLLDPVSPRRTWAGRLLLSVAAVAVLSATATVIPASAADPAPPPAAPLPLTAPAAPAPPSPPLSIDEDIVMLRGDDAGEAVGDDVPGETVDVIVDADGRRREVRRIVIRDDGRSDAAPDAGDGSADGATAPRPRRVTMMLPSPGLSREETEATLIEQGIDPAKARTIAEKLEARRLEKRPTLPPMPPMPPLPPTAAWSGKDGVRVAMSGCKAGSAPRVMIRRTNRDGTASPPEVRALPCGAAPVDNAQELAALQAARARIAAEKPDGRGMSAEIRQSVLADLDNAIADLKAARP